MAFWLLSSFALSALSWTFSSSTSVYLFVSRSMDCWSLSSTSTLRVLLVKSQVATDPRAPPGRSHMRISFRNMFSMLTNNYWLMPMERSHLGTSNEGQSFAATWLWPMIFTSGKRWWKDFT